MSMTVTGIQAYNNALSEFTKAQKQFQSATASIAAPETTSAASFTDTLQNSLATVNDMQTQKNTMIQAFASGENQNVHELMISMQKAGLAVNLTSAVRNKVLEAYRELSKIQF